MDIVKELLGRGASVDLASQVSLLLRALLLLDEITSHPSLSICKQPRCTCIDFGCLYG